MRTSSRSSAPAGATGWPRRYKRSSCSLTDEDLQTIEAAVPATEAAGDRYDPAQMAIARLGALTVLTREEILDAAEEVLRRYGPAKANVVDVARALNVSHGSVYRHFPSKAALREAVAERWLESVAQPLDEITDAREWFDTLIATKRSRAQQDPELFATYVNLAHESGDVITRHVDTDDHWHASSATAPRPAR